MEPTLLPKTILNRLAALEAAKAVETEPVDMRLVLARIYMMLVACHEGRKQTDESDLTAYARACGYRCETELWRIAISDRAEFARRYAAVRAPAYGAYQCASPALAKSIREGQDEEKRQEAGNVCDAVIETFLTEESEAAVWGGLSRSGSHGNGLHLAGRPTSLDLFCSAGGRL
jgi:hypothetical protein